MALCFELLRNSKLPGQNGVAMQCKATGQISTSGCIEKDDLINPRINLVNVNNGIPNSSRARLKLLPALAGITWRVLFLHGFGNDVHQVNLTQPTTTPRISPTGDVRNNPNGIKRYERLR
ncbi:hypothetical protein quinque_001959 [Culex quinquefasciatus]